MDKQKLKAMICKLAYVEVLVKRDFLEPERQQFLVDLHKETIAELSEEEIRLYYYAVFGSE